MPQIIQIIKKVLSLNYSYTLKFSSHSNKTSSEKNSEEQNLKERTHATMQIFQERSYVKK